ncbi:MAG: tryptophan--tRNA ligase [Candidatus Dojkabacteria bacterium]|nr:MAG: tryptophan--tRNA ligase [Candidatus Dojkabacteria bacterium]
MIKDRILTGERPTGPLHLGHYVGTLKSRIELQDSIETFILSADLQAITDNVKNTEKVRNNVFQVIQDNIAVGIDPQKVTFFIQSQIPEIAELTMYFMNLVTHSEVIKNPTVKTEIKEKKFGSSTPFGFVAYPVSQAADILIVRANTVPVGDDQKPMIELTRDIARRFNKTYMKEVFPEVKGIYSEVGRLVGTDGNSKMSKSLGNTIYLIDDDQTVHEKVMKMYTDPNRIRATDPGKVEGNPVFIYHDIFNPDREEVDDLKKRYRQGKVGDVEVKEKLSRAINNFLEPIRERRSKYPVDIVKEIAFEGTKRTKQEARKTIEIVRDVMKLNYK